MNKQVIRLPVKPKLQRLTRVAAYARVSIWKDAMLHSLAAQVSYYSNLIKQHPGWCYAGVYADEAMTGTKSDRPEFQRLLADCRAGKIDMVITKSVSRFARNTLTSLETVRELKGIGVDVYFEAENLHSMSGEGELMLTIVSAIAQEESRSVSENCKWRIRKKLSEGGCPFLRMYGYQVKDGEFTIVPEEAEVVRLIFSSYLYGMGTAAIATMLNERHIPTLRSKISEKGKPVTQRGEIKCDEATQGEARRGEVGRGGAGKGEARRGETGRNAAGQGEARRGGAARGAISREEGRNATGQGAPSRGAAWSKRTVKDILKNEKVAGNLLLQKTFRVDYLTKKKKLNRGELDKYYIKNNHEAIIDQETFDRVQDEMARRAKRFAKGRSADGESDRSEVDESVISTGYDSTGTSTSTNTSTSTSTSHWLSSKITCGLCGKHFVRKMNHKAPTWICPTYLYKKKAACPSRRISERVLFPILADVLGVHLDAQTIGINAIRAQADQITALQAEANQISTQQIQADHTAALQIQANRIQNITVYPDGRLTIDLDGRMIERRWENPSRSLSWTDEMKLEAVRREQERQERMGQKQSTEAI